MKALIFFGGFFVIWIFMLGKLGANFFGISLSVIFTLIWFAIWGGVTQGSMQYKRDKYLADKYDEEKRK